MICDGMAFVSPDDFMFQPHDEEDHPPPQDFHGHLSLSLSLWHCRSIVRKENESTKKSQFLAFFNCLVSKKFVGSLYLTFTETLVFPQSISCKISCVFL